MTFRIQRLKKRGKISASNWNQMADRLEALINVNVAAPLMMSHHPSGLLIGADFEGTAGTICKAKVKTGTWPEFKTWTDGAPGANNQRTIWEFELPSTVQYKDTETDRWLSSSGDNKWTGSGNYVKAFNLTRGYVPDGIYCTLFKIGEQYYFEHWMPAFIHGSLQQDLNSGSSATAGVTSQHGPGMQGAQFTCHDDIIGGSKKVPSGAKIIAAATRFGSVGDWVWRFFLLQTPNCPQSLF